MSVTAYPLTWPATMPRQKTREKGQFRTTLPGALGNVRESIHAFSRDSGKVIDGLVISSNVTLGVSKPDDPGVAIWFTWDDLPICIPIDRYQTVEANLQAIHHVLEARRTELRHGTLALVRATFTGFAALPAPASKPHWRSILKFATFDHVSVAIVNERFKKLAKDIHPDRGGGNDAMAELNRARDEALQEIAS